MQASAVVVLVGGHSLIYWCGLIQQRFHIAAPR